MSKKPPVEIFKEYFRCCVLFEHIRDYLPLKIDLSKRNVNSDELKLDTIIEEMSERAKSLNFDHVLFKRHLNNYVKGINEGRKPRSLKIFLQSYLESIANEIRGIPNTLNKSYDALCALIEIEYWDKADQVYDAMVLLKDNVTLEVEKVLQKWKKDNKEESYHGFFWVSLDGQEILDAVSRCRFRERFNIGEFEATFDEVESMIASSLLEDRKQFEAFRHIFGDTMLKSVAYNLWLVSRNRSLSNRLRDWINVTLWRISEWQFAEGYWADFEIGRNPSIYITALCSLNILKLSISEQLKEKGTLGAKWIIDTQNADGSWSTNQIIKKQLVKKPDLFVTLLCLEVLVRSGLKDIQRSIKLGVDWVMNQQKDLGWWEDDYFPFPFITVLVLEFLKLNEIIPKKMDKYLEMGKGFLNRSSELSREDNSNSRRLAIIASFQGIEAFLYSVLTHPTINMKIFKDGNETIGMRKALNQFQNYLQSNSFIKRNEVIPYRNSLDRLAYLRDQIVHKCIDVEQSECSHLVDDAIRFVSNYSSNIFGFDVFL